MYFNFTNAPDILKQKDNMLILNICVLIIAPLLKKITFQK